MQRCRHESKHTDSGVFNELTVVEGLILRGELVVVPREDLEKLC